MWLAVIGTICVIAVAPFLFEAQRVTISQAVRDRSGGHFARLKDGVTHYRWHGPDTGPVVVAIHGLTTPAVVWDAIIPTFTDRGFRVLSYDLYGRGLSDAPKAPQSVDFFVSQLVALLDDQAIEAPATFVGYSMGANISASFAAENPARVDRMIVVAPAGIEPTRTLFDRLACSVPPLGDWLFAACATGRMRRQSLGSAKPKPIEDMQRFQLSRRGYLPAVLSSMRGALARSLRQEHIAISNAGIPMLAIWGRDDTAVPLRGLGTLATWNRGAEHVDVAGAGHGLPYTHSAQVNDAIAGWLDAGAKRR